jgi:hypothetical protein
MQASSRSSTRVDSSRSSTKSSQGEIASVPVQSMDQEEYLKNRVDDQIAWYDRRSATYQAWFYRLRMVEIICAATIPLLAGYVEPFSDLKIVIGVLGLLISVVAGVLALYRFQENWTAYRATCESLKHEKYLFLTKTPPYDGTDAFPLFVQRAEVLMAQERTAWVQNMSATGKDKPQ